ncbi:MAG: cytochrome c maturation protein CcmE [Chthonomonas sp.]|nr:cytochrome c maturation protein CcmE [Chthonomonas sp.]
MKKSVILSSVLASVALTAMVSAFLMTANPTVTVDQAVRSKGEKVYLAGEIVSGSMISKPRARSITFTLRDDHGKLVTVFHEGHAPANMGTTTRVVAVGSYHDGSFKAEKLMTKCPSKYESGKPESLNKA